MPIVGEKFDCDTTIDKERLCGMAVFSKEDDASQQKITTIQMAQNIVGATSEQVIAKLVEKYGSFTDSFDATVKTGGGLFGKGFTSRQYVWGPSFQHADNIDDPVTFTRQKTNWQIEAVIFQPEVNRTVLLLQLVGAQTEGASAAATDVRL